MNLIKAILWTAVSLGYVAVGAKFALVAYQVDTGARYSVNPHVAAWAGYGFAMGFGMFAIITTAHAVELIRKGR